MSTDSVFALPPTRSAKAAARLISADEAHLHAVRVQLEAATTAVAAELAQTQATPARLGQELLHRDQETRRLTAQLRLLRRYSLDLCLGRMVPLDGSPPVYIGRVGLKDSDGTPLLLDWRTPAAEPFFAATVAHPMGLSSRRRYRWRHGQILDYWDETLTPGATGPEVTPDDDSALLASLAQARTPRMRDVLATIAADQDAIIRADPHGPLLVDGGPGTGKTVVALHRAAYLIYSDPRLHRHGSNILLLGPHQQYLAYVADVLPSLGEDSVRSATLEDLIPEHATAVTEPDPRAAALKHSSTLVAAIDAAVALYEEPPTQSVDLETAWGATRLTAQDWTDAFAAVTPNTPHNHAREQIWEEFAEILAPRLHADSSLDDSTGASDDRSGEHPDTHDVLTDLRRNPDLTDTLHRAWPLLEPTDIVADLWEVPAYLRRCAPDLTPEERALLRRSDPRAWTDADLPLLDAARYRLGDPRLEQQRRARDTENAAIAREMDAVVKHLIETDDSEMLVMSMLRGTDLRDALAPDTATEHPQDTLDGPFAHIVIDEAQELTDAQWAMVLRRCPSRSLTIVGDRAQARHGFTQTWTDRLHHVGLDRVRHATLTTNYRTPTEVMAVAEPVIRAALPHANVPTSIRSSGHPVRRAHPSEIEALLHDWLTTNPEGTAAVIIPLGTHPPSPVTQLANPDRIRSLTPQTAKGLEFDLVILLNPDHYALTLTGAVDQYVAMTRTTSELVIIAQ